MPVFVSCEPHIKQTMIVTPWAPDNIIYLIWKRYFGHMIISRPIRAQYSGHVTILDQSEAGTNLL